MAPRKLGRLTPPGFPKCAACHNPLELYRLRGVGGDRAKPCQNPQCQLAFCVYRTLEQVQGDIAQAIAGKKTSYDDAWKAMRLEHHF